MNKYIPHTPDDIRQMLDKIGVGSIDELFADIPEALDSTVEILNKVEHYSIDHAPILPQAALPEGIELEACFNADNTRLERLERYVSDISEYAGVLHSVKNSDGIFKYEITPYVRDVALIGLKCPDDLVREIFYSGLGMEALEERENIYNQYMKESNGELKWQNTDREE